MVLTYRFFVLFVVSTQNLQNFKLLLP